MKFFKKVTDKTLTIFHTTNVGTPNAIDIILIGKFFNSKNVGTSLIIDLKTCPITVNKILTISNIISILSPSFFLIFFHNIIF